jgi:hypothetical protein
MATTNLKEILDYIKEVYASEADTFSFIEANASALGVYNVDSRTKKFSIRSERTPSAKARPNLSLIDFGGDGVTKDLVAHLQDELGYSFPDAVKLLADLAGVPVEGNVEVKRVAPPTPIKKKVIYLYPFKDEVLKSYIDNSFKKPSIFKELVGGLCRECSIKEMRKAVKLFQIGLSEFTHKKGEKNGQTEYRLFIPEKNLKGEALGCFRYNRNLTPKGLLRSGFEKDGVEYRAKRVLFGSHLIPLFNNEKPIIFTEGHSDCVVNNAKGIASVTSGSATTPIPEEGLEALKGREVHFFYDCDLAGMKGLHKKIAQIKAFNANQNESDKIRYKIFWWAKSFIDKKTKQKVETEALYKALNEKEELSFVYSELKIFSQEEVAGGYDFIDFHRDFKIHSNYESFLERYSYCMEGGQNV